MTHLIRVSFQWFTVLLCFLVVEVSNGDFGMETQQKPVNEKSLKIRIHHKTNESVDYLYIQYCAKVMQAEFGEFRYLF